MQRTVRTNSASLVLSLSACFTVTGTFLNQPALVVTGISSGTGIAILKLKKLVQTQENLEKQVLELKVTNDSLKTELERTQNTQKKQQQRIQTQDSRQRLQVKATQKLQHQQKVMSGKIANLEQKAIATDEEIKSVSRKQNCLSQNQSSQQKIPPAQVELPPITHVYIDGGNLFNASQELGIEIDFKALTTLLSQEAARIKFKYYIGVSSQSYKQQFISYLEKLKYEVLRFPLLVRDNGKLKIVGDDVQIALDMKNEVKSGDRVILVSGDGDFLPAVKEIQYLGVHVTVVAKSNMLNSELDKIADKIILLDDIQYQVARHEKIKIT